MFFSIAPCSENMWSLVLALTEVLFLKWRQIAVTLTLRPSYVNLALLSSEAKQLALKTSLKSLATEKVSSTVVVVIKRRGAESVSLADAKTVFFFFFATGKLALKTRTHGPSKNSITDCVNARASESGDSRRACGTALVLSLLSLSPALLGTGRLFFSRINKTCCCASRGLSLCPRSVNHLSPRLCNVGLISTGPWHPNFEVNATSLPKRLKICQAR